MKRWKLKDIMKQMFVLVVTLLLIPTKANDLLNPCDHASTCGECLETNGHCYWCADEGYTSSDPRKPRCNLKPYLGDCSNKQIADGDVKVTENVNFGNKVQVKPQKVTMNLRPGQSQSFVLSVQPAENYPVRLYYLMDMSNSMKDDLDNLKTLGTKIANEIKNVTKDYKLAFGTFVDKPVIPFVQPELKNHPCAAKDQCAPTFGYRHIFDFSKDAKLFEKAVGEQEISGNLDTPEGGFDALMQVAACGNKIGWDAIGQSRRIVVFVTDATPHISGDGKVGGITTQNDGACHLNRVSTHLMYSKSQSMDYPSISLLKATLKANKVVPIIAVTADVKPIYEKIALEWKDIGAGIGSLERDSSNIVDLIRDNYKKISTTVRLSDNAPSNIVVKYKVTGGCKSAIPTVENECTDVGINQKVDFRVSVKVTNCPENWRDGQKFTINVPGFGDVDVDTKMICECGCNKTGRPNSPKCSGKGEYKCGICDCKEGRFGKICECDGESQADTSLCVMPNDTSVCSGFGSCVCGKCECNQEEDVTKVISGTFCQCNNFGCDRFESKICGGIDRGLCKCGQCLCKEAFQGENCGQANCTLGKKNCLKDGVVCTGNGECACDQCECKTGCKGAYCENCVTVGKCKSHEDCVKCEYGLGEVDFCASCKQANNNITYNMINSTNALLPCDYASFEIGEEKCVVTIDKTKVVRYSIEVDIHGVHTAKMEACIKPIIYGDDRPMPIMVIVFIIIGTIVGVALLLLLAWKLVVTIYDRREYASFIRDMGSRRWNTANPIYKNATTTHRNPTYSLSTAT